MFHETTVWGIGAAGKPGGVTPSALLEQPDGRIVVGGMFPNSDGYDRFGALRVNADESVDASFGGGGVRVIETGGVYPERPSAMALAADGKIVLVGTKTYYAGSDWLVVRLTAEGDLDSTFGESGLVVTPIKSDSPGDFGISTDIAYAVSIDSSGRIIVAGEGDVPREQGSIFGGGQRLIALARYLPGGELDATFGEGGILMTAGGTNDSGGRNDAAATAMVMAEGGAVIVGGHAEPFGKGRDFMLAKFRMNDPGAVRVEVIDGTLVITGTPQGDEISMGLGLDGRILVLVKGLDQAYEPRLFSRILIRGLAGDDVVDVFGLSIESVMHGSPLPIPVTIEGGEGNDWIAGCDWSELLHGGPGDDTIFAGDGNDTVFAHRGGDEIHGGGGNDYLNGGPDADTVFGDANNDQIFALDNVADVLDGGDGFDRAAGDEADEEAGVEALLG